MRKDADVLLRECFNTTLVTVLYANLETFWSVLIRFNTTLVTVLFCPSSQIDLLGNGFNTTLVTVLFDFT